MHSMKGRDHAIKCMLDRRQEQFIDLQGITVFIASWNVNGQSPGSICLREWLTRTPDPPDIYAIGFQELDLSKEAFLFNDTPKETEWKYVKHKYIYIYIELSKCRRMYMCKGHVS